MHQLTIVSRRSFLKLSAASLAALGLSVAQEDSPARDAADVVFINLADTHSAYDNYPRLLETLRSLIADYGDTPVYILFNGDIFELGNVVAARSQGEADWEFLRALQALAPVIVNLGNHEFHFMPPEDFVAAAQAEGITVIGNILSRDSGMLIAPAFVTVAAGDYTIDVIGTATNAANTYPASLREDLVLPQSSTWLASSLNSFARSDFAVLMSHAGVVDDRRTLPTLPEQMLFAVGGHDHLVLHEVLLHPEVEGLHYLHNGFKAERFNIAELRLHDEGHVEAHYRDVMLLADLPEDEALQQRIAALREQHLEPADLAVLGSMERDYSVREAAQWAVETLREATGADVAMLNHTSFGSGLAAGEVPLYRFNEFLRFDNDVMRAEVDGETLQAILAIANQDADTPLDMRTGDFVYSTALEPQAGERYVMVTSSWIALPFNVGLYLGVEGIAFEQLPDISVKGLLRQALADA